jgi:formylglycine-generating enzyme required for sulfatase activity
MTTPHIVVFSQMTDLFSDDDLRDLCFALQFNYEDLPSAFGISGKVRELILAMDRVDRLAELLTAVQSARPQAPWPHLAAGYTVADLLGEPAVPPKPNEPETIRVAAGPFIMGSSNGEPAEAPPHEVTLPTFFMGKYPITNQEYAEFINATGYAPPPVTAGWMLGKPPKDKLTHPVISVTWYDAMVYCHWLCEYTGKQYRLPTEAEWEKAARGTDGRIYPWGNEWAADAANLNGSGTTDVDAFAAYASPYGCVDMVGNASEWTLTRWGEDRQQPAYPYPTNSKDNRNDPANDPSQPRLRRIFRGGSYKDTPHECRCTARSHIRPDSASLTRSFRVMRVR